MELTAQISVRKTNHSRIHDVDFNNLEFGKYIADHMLVCDYINRSMNGWGTPQILPYANLSLSPATLALHYGQTVFEGMKAFRMEDGTINIFRIEKHYERFVKSLERMCMAIVPKEIFIEGLIQLIRLDKAWVPSAQGSALYIRPFVFASEARFGVKVSDEYRFIIFTGPVPSLYANPIKVKVETQYTYGLQEEEPVQQNAEEIMALHFCQHKLPGVKVMTRFYGQMEKRINILKNQE